jgi:tetratricopeptide (TPR) repeat protein
VEAKRIVEQASQAAERISAFDAATQQALAEIDKYSDLPVLYITTLERTPAELPAAEVLLQMEEADILTVLGARIRPQPPDKLARAFIALAQYWINIGNYPRAIARYSRAAELMPNGWEAYVGLAYAFRQVALQRGTRPPVREQMLRTSEKYCEEALQKGGRNDIRVLGTHMMNATDFGNYQMAVDLYKEVQKLEPDNPSVTYNLASLYACKLNRYGDALDLLSKLPAKMIREFVAHDPDFDSLRKDPTHGAAFATLVTGAASAPTQIPATAEPRALMAR